MRKNWKTDASNRAYLRKNPLSFYFYSDGVLLIGVGGICFVIWDLIQKDVTLQVFFAVFFIALIILIGAYVKILQRDKRRLSEKVRKDRAYRRFINNLEEKSKEEQQKMLLEEWVQLLKPENIKKVKAGYEGVWQGKNILLCDQLPAMKRSYDLIFMLRENNETISSFKQTPIVLLTEQDLYRLWEKEEEAIFCTVIDKDIWNKGSVYSLLLFLWALVWKSKVAMLCAVVCLCFYIATVVKKYRNNHYFSLKKAVKISKNRL